MTTSRVTKAAVITCSVLLAGGYLIYANSDALRTSSKRAHITAGEGGAPLETEFFTAPSAEGHVKDLYSPTTQPRAMISSSKFAAVSVPPAADPRTMAFSSKVGAIDLMPTTQPRTMVQSGWKSAPVTIVPKEEPRTMASSSKSFQVNIPQGNDQRQMLLSSKGGVVLAPNPPFSQSGSVPDGRVMAVDLNPATQPSTQPATQPSTWPATRRVFMGGSKSKAVDVLPQQQR